MQHRDGPRRLLREHWPLALICVVAGVGMGWHPNRNGWANAYYSVVAWSGAQSWPAMFFGSLEPSSVVSTDKPPLAFWGPALLVRLTGLHPWSLVVTQLLFTIATIVMLHNVVRRLVGRAAGLVAAATYAVTPIVGALALQNQPDVLLTLWCLTAVYAVVRFLEEAEAHGRGRSRWLVLCGVSLGGAFLTKWVLGWFVVPALLWALWPVLRRGRAEALRILAVGGGATLATSFSWLVILAIRGRAGRPFPDSPTGNLLDLVLGQNGVSRLGGSGGGAISGHPGPFRLVIMPFADQVGWFVPLALLLFTWLAWHRSELTGPERVGMRVFGGWALALVLLFSAMGGAMHPYYTVQLAVPIAGLVALGTRALWVHRHRWLLALSLAGTAAYGAWVSIVSESPNAAAVVGLAMALGGAALLAVRRAGATRHTGWALIAAALAIGPVVTHVGTLSHSVVGPDSMAGWVVHERADPLPTDLASFLSTQQGVRWIAAAPQGTPAAELSLQAGRPVLPLAGFTGTGGAPTIAQLQGFVAAGELRYVAMIGRYTSNPTQTPAALKHTELARLIEWARATGCPLVVGRIALLDLTDHTCH